MRPNILVIGSAPTDFEASTFHSACEALGEEFTKHAKGVILCSSRDRTADPSILKGIERAKEHVPVHFMRPAETADEDEGVREFLALHRRQLGGKLQEEVVAGGWRAVHLRAVQNADIVLVLGGTRRGATPTMHMAATLGKTVVPLAGFGGEAASNSDFKNAFRPAELASLARPYDGPGWAEMIIQVAFSVHKRRPFAEFTTRSLVGLSAVALLVGMAWVSISSHTNWLGPSFSIAALVFLAALTGALLPRAVYRMRFGLVDAVLAIAGALLLSMAVLIAAETLAALLLARSILDPVDADAASLGVRLSLVGLYAGLQAEAFLKALIRRAQFE